MITFDKKNILSTGVGRRKSASALVKILPGNGEIVVNQKSGIDYFHSKVFLLHQSFSRSYFN